MLPVRCTNDLSGDIIITHIGNKCNTQKWGVVIFATQNQGRREDMPPEELKKAVKHRLIDLGMTQRQLCKEITARTGRYCDNASIKRVLDGTTKRSPIRKAICEILGLPEE